MKSIKFFFVGLLIGALWAVLVGQAPAAPASGTKAETPPVLAEVDRLKLINALQAVEIATLKFQAAATELQTARGAADTLIKAATVPGWQLNDKLDYVKAPAGGKGDK